MKISATLSALAIAGSCLAQNPAISAIYTPDPAPYVHGDKVYLFVDHDEDDATYFLMKDWLVFSTEDMVNWQYLGAQVNTATFNGQSKVIVPGRLRLLSTKANGTGIYVATPMTEKMLYVLL